jgi:RNA polymerase sigma-70 factor (ECF subfamily)
VSSSVSLVVLLSKAREGDDTARDELFAKCRSYLALVARAQVESWLQAKVDASDLVQQTLLDAHRGLRDFRGRTDAEWFAWLRQILKRNATDFVRQYGVAEKRQAGREVSLQRDDSHHFGLEPSDSAESPSDFLIRHEQEVIVAETLTQLPADYQEVIILRNLQRLPFDEVAQRMGRSRPAVQMLWMRAIRKLAESCGHTQ